MGSQLELKAKKVSLFALDQESSLPIARMPFYAEVGVRSTLPPPPIPLDDRFDDAMRGALNSADDACFSNQQCWNGVAEALREAISRILSIDARNELAADNDAAIVFLDRVIRRARESQAGATLLGLDVDILRRLLDESLRAEADLRGLQVIVLPPLPEIAWAHPLGILATDHEGYLSFDLTCLPTDVNRELQKAIAARVLDPKATPDTTVWVYPMGREEQRYDALSQGRFAHDAVLLKLHLVSPELPVSFKNFGLLSMQNPDLIDWRLSPGSFASNPGTLVGADGCESILPANNALHEFYFHQVIGVPAAEVGLPIDAAAAGKVRPGYVNEYRLAFIPIGHSLGQILYSFPLAPGESVNFAVVDWTRRDSALRDENTKLDESLVHELRRDRIITETVRASIDEWQRGGSIMGGQATSAGGALGGSGMGIAAGASNAIGGAYSTTSGSRDIAADTVQKLSDNVAQAATSSRELHSTVVVQSAQAEHEAIETRTVVNYNHSHALTILYYEVLRHFRVVTEFVRRRPALLTNVHGGIAYVVTTPPPARHEIYWPAIYENRKVLEAAVLDDRFKEGFNIVERRRHRERIAEVVGATPPSPAPNPASRKFVYFMIEMKTGGMFTQEMDDHGKRVEVTARLVGPTIAHELVNPVGSEILNQRGSFRQADAVNSFVAVLKGAQGGQLSITWDLISGVEFWVNPQGNSEQKVSFEHIKVTAIDIDGAEEVLINQSYAAGHLIITDEGANVVLPTRRPPPSVPGGPTPESIEEEAKFKEFNEHLLNRRPHYERALRLGATPAMRAFELASLGVGGGASLLEKVENRPLEVLGEFVAYPCVDPEWSQRIMDTIERRLLPDIEPVEQLITLPTRGVFAEAKLGHCNASEEIDNTRFWDWQQSPIPHMAPEIAPVQPVMPQPIATPGLEPTQFPASLLNIVNPPNAPDPQGMSAALTALATANMFRDMSGLREVSDLLKKLSDNSVAIAGVAQKAATGGVGTGTGQSGSGSGQTGIGVGQTGVGSGGTNSETTPSTGVGGNPIGSQYGAGSGTLGSKSVPTTPQSIGEVNDLANGIRKQLPPQQANALVGQLYENVVDKTVAEGSGGLITNPSQISGSLVMTNTAFPTGGQRLCFPVSAFQTSQFSSGFGTIAERLIEADYCDTLGCSPSTTYFDKNNPTEYRDFLVAHNPSLATEPLATKLANKFPKVSRPDIMGDDGTRKDYYEIKPFSPAGATAGVAKLALIVKFMNDLGLPYVPGTTYSPSRDIPLMSGTILGSKVGVSLNVQRHVPGIVTYTICLNGELVELLAKVALATLLAWIAAQLLTMSAGALVVV